MFLKIEIQHHFCYNKIIIESNGCCMNKLYNNQTNITSEFSQFLEKYIPSLRKTQLNFMPSILYGMINSKSLVAKNIALELNEELKFAKLDSVTKRINRFFSNSNFNPYDFWNDFIKVIVNNYKCKHDNKKVHITFDHMFSLENYTVFMMSMRIGAQGIPIYFQTFKNKCSDAFKLNVILNGIRYVSNLFSDEYELIFLADRWFNSTEIMNYIDSLGHTYCIRLKGNVSVYKDNIKTKAKKLKKRKYHAVVHRDVYITDNRFKSNIVISKSIDCSTPWIIATNNDVEHAVHNYSFRFGSVECLFKNQKSNGFNLEKISNASLETFTAKYTLCCVAITYLTALGTDYAKNTKCYKNCRFETHKVYIREDGVRIKKRILSLFQTGLTLFTLALNSCDYVRLSFSFKIYDI